MTQGSFASHGGRTLDGYDRERVDAFLQPEKMSLASGVKDGSHYGSTGPRP